MKTKNEQQDTGKKINLNIDIDTDMKLKVSSFVEEEKSCEKISQLYSKNFILTLFRSQLEKVKQQEQRDSKELANI